MVTRRGVAAALGAAKVDAGHNTRVGRAAAVIDAALPTEMLTKIPLCLSRPGTVWAKACVAMTASAGLSKSELQMAFWQLVLACR